MILHIAFHNMHYVCLGLSVIGLKGEFRGRMFKFVCLKYVYGTFKLEIRTTARQYWCYH